MRLATAGIVAALLVGLVGCVGLRGADLGGAGASANGVDLSLALRRAAPWSSAYDLVSTVSNTSSDSAQFASPTGELAHVTIETAATHQIVFDSASVSRAGEAAQFGGSRIETTLTPGASRTTTYAVNLPRGSYVIRSASTGPFSGLIWSDVEVP